jgi:hypothetical protein
MTTHIRRIAALIALGATIAAISAAGAQASWDQRLPRVPADYVCVQLTNPGA